MKMKQLTRLAAGMALTGLIVGCTDDNYHINDADYLSRFTVNNLAIPLKVETIRLDSIVDLTDGTNVKKYKDPVSGKEYYALTETGDISSDPIKIDRVDVSPKNVAPTHVILSINPQHASKRRLASGKNGLSNAEFYVEEMLTEFDYNTIKVDEAIKDIKSFITVDPVSISITLSIPEELKVVNTEFTDIKLKFPKGLKMADGVNGGNAMVTYDGARDVIGKYHPETGLVEIDRIDLTDPHHQVIKLTADYFDLDILDKENDDEEYFDINEDRDLMYHGKIGVLSGGFMIYGANSPADIPQTITLSADYHMDHFGIRSFSGAVDYYVQESRIDPIHLDDLPDFLQDPETNIIIADPQFYFRVTNSASKFGAKGAGVITIKSEFANKGDYSSESPELKIPAKEISDMILSSTGKVENPLPGYEANLEEYKYPAMKNILSGKPGSDPDGLPAAINVAFEKPHFYGDNIKDFPVENDKDKGELAPMDGHYEFFAPLAFDANSIIVYKDKVDLSDSDMDDIYIQRLVVDANGFSSFPVDVKLSAVAYDIANNPIGLSLVELGGCGR